MPYESLSLDGFIQEIKDASSGSLARKFCFVLGAGASRSSGIPTGKELVDKWDEELKVRNPERYAEWKLKLQIPDGDGKYAFYQEYYEERFRREPADGINFLKKEMADKEPNAGYAVLAWLLEKTPHHVVITTNFDHLMEKAILFYGKEEKLPLVIGHPGLAAYIPSDIKEPTIVKIHNDLLLGPKNGTDVKTLDSKWRESLSCIFEQYSPVFIGYGGNDPSLMDFLSKESEKFRQKRWKCPYWLLHKGKEPKAGKVRDFLDAADGYCISHNDFDETIFRLGAALGYTLPSKDVFIEKAEKRYDKLPTLYDKVIGSGRLESAARAGSGEKAELYDAYKDVMGSSAEERMQELVKNYPENAGYRTNLGIALSDQKRCDEALAEFQKAVELEPDNEEYRANLETILREMSGKA